MIVTVRHSCCSLWLDREFQKLWTHLLAEGYEHLPEARTQHR